MQKKVTMDVTVSLNNILDFINSMSLSASNKRWLASKLIEEADKGENPVSEEVIISRDDLRIDPEIASLFEGFHLPDDYNVREDYTDYLAKKY